MARQSKITAYPYEDFEITFAVKESDDADAAAQDITGWTIVLNVSEAPNSPTKMISNKACTTVSAAAGTTKATLSSAELGALPPRAYYWDAYRTDAGSVRCLGFGTFNVPSVAKYPV